MSFPPYQGLLNIKHLSNKELCIGRKRGKKKIKNTHQGQIKITGILYDFFSDYVT